MPTPLLIKYLLMTNISKEQFATLIVRILFALLIGQHKSTNKIFMRIGNRYCLLLMTKRTDCSSFVCWDNYSVHSTNKIEMFHDPGDLRMPLFTTRERTPTFSDL